MTTVQSRVYREGVLQAEGFPIASVSELLAEPDTVVWVDLESPTHEDLQELADELGFHELAVEDALSEGQRPKLARYESHVFVSLRTVDVDVAEAALHETKVDAFFHRRWLVTVRPHDGPSMAPVVGRWDRSPQLAGHGAAFLLYGLLDVVVDGYFDAVQRFDDFFDDVSEEIFAERPISPPQQRRWFAMRRALVRFHRLVAPLREVLSSLMRWESTAVGAPLYPYYQDVYDHVLRVGEATDSLRDLVATIVETNLSLRDYRQNRVMKQVTSWAAIVAVPTLITGWYGMNVPYPGFGQHWGVAAATVIVAFTSGVLYALFRRHDWL